MSISQGKNIKVKQDLCVILKSSSYFSLSISPPTPLSVIQKLWRWSRGRWCARGGGPTMCSEEVPGCGMNWEVSEVV